MSASTESSKLNELRLLEAYVNCMDLDVPMLSAAKSEREWDWFFHKLEEGFLVAEVEEDVIKLKLAKRFMKGRQLCVWCDLVKQAAQPPNYERIRDDMYLAFFPQSDYYTSLMELFGGIRETGNESPRRKMSLVGVKLVIGTAKETMARVAKRYNRETPPESFWYQFAIRLMTPNVKELFDAKMAELIPKPDPPQDPPTEDTTEEPKPDGGSDSPDDPKPDDNKPMLCPDMPIEQMLKMIKDPNARSMRAPHKFRRTVRKNRVHNNKKPVPNGKPQPAYPSLPIANLV